MAAHARPLFRAVRGLLWLAVTVAFLAGCAIADEPQLRIGSLPYPGLFTNHEYAEPAALGRHSYDGWSSLAADEPEHTLGVLYTRKAGFIDIAHVRHNMDWTRYVALYVADAMRRRKAEVIVDSMEMTSFRIVINYPDDWWQMPPSERERIIHEMSIRIGQRVAYQMSIWHEMLTWYDYGVTLIIPEKGSAFTYEDMVSNLLGALVGADAMRVPGEKYDDAATRMLDEYLRRLEAVPAADAARRTEAVKGRWWTNGSTLKRYVDTGLDYQPITGWLVTLEGETPATPEPLVLPKLIMTDGRDMTELFHVEIDADDFIAEELRDMFDPPRTVLIPDRDFPIIMSRIRDEMIEAEGEGVDEPGE